jgi:hypothetical protein
MTMLYLAFLAIRASLALWYIRRSRLPPSAMPATVLQPILSGDPDLEQNLSGNVLQNPGSEFLWLVDEDDLGAC